MAKFTTVAGIFFILALVIFSQLVDAKEDIISTGDYNVSNELLRALPTSDPGDPQSLSSMSSARDDANSLSIHIYKLYWSGELYRNDVTNNNPIQVSWDTVPDSVMRDLITNAKRAWKTKAPEKSVSVNRNTTTNEYSLVFDKFDESDSDCSIWGDVQPDDIAGYQISFNSSYDWKYPSRTSGTLGIKLCSETTTFTSDPFRITEENNTYQDSAYPALTIKVQVGDFNTRIGPGIDTKNFATGDLSIQNLTASYVTYDKQAGTARDDRGNMYYTDRRYGTLTVPIKNQISLEVNTIDLTPEESLALFKSIRITEIHKRTSKYWLRKGNEFFNNASYEAAISSYKNAEDNQEASDKIGISLYRLSRYNDTIDWFSSARPKSSEAWNSYGLALRAMNLEAQAEYAFNQVVR